MQKSNLAKRLLFALPATPFGWWFVNSTIAILPPSAIAPTSVGAFPGHVLALALVFLGCAEYIGMLAHSFPKNGFWVSYIWLAFQFVSYFVPEWSLSNRFNQSYLNTFMLFLLVAGEAVYFGKKSARWRRASLLFSGTVFLSIAGFSMLNFYDAPLQTVFPTRFSHPMLSQMGIVTIIGSVFLCDSAAYFVGKSLGKHHFSTTSPKKTIEGAIGGLVASTITSTLCWIFLTPDSARAKYGILFGVALGLTIGVVAQLGDLLMSLIKRSFRVKDAGTLLPGHGGILDRFDSVFLTAPVVNLLLIIVTRLAP